MSCSGHWGRQVGGLQSRLLTARLCRIQRGSSCRCGVLPKMLCVTGAASLGTFAEALEGSCAASKGTSLLWLSMRERLHHAGLAESRAGMSGWGSSSCAGASCWSPAGTQASQHTVGGCMQKSSYAMDSAEGVDVTAPACGCSTRAVLRQAGMSTGSPCQSLQAARRPLEHSRLMQEPLRRALEFNLQACLTAVCGRSPGSNAGFSVKRHSAVAPWAAGHACPGTGGARCHAGQICTTTHDRFGAYEAV